MAIQGSSDKIMDGKLISSMTSKPINPLDYKRFSDILKNHVQHRIRDNFHEYQNKNHKINSSFVIPDLRSFEANKNGFTPSVNQNNWQRTLNTVSLYHQIKI